MKKLTRITIFVLVVLCFSLEYSKETAQAQTARTRGVQRKTCKNDSRVVDRCFWVRGNLAIGSGNPAARVKISKNKRVFGVKDDEKPILPENIASLLTTENEIFGSFYVCPFTEYRRGQMQTGCVESATNLKAKN